MRAALIAATMLIPFAAAAQPVTPHDVHWYMEHPDILYKTLRVCHSNSAYASTPDCDNAERAGNGLDARRYAHHSGVGMIAMTDPAWWSANPFVRSGVLMQCQRRAPGDELVFPYCKAAAQSALQDLSRR